MIRLQIAVSNLQPTNLHIEPVNCLSFKLASITTTIPITEGFGGKSLILEVSPEEMQNFFHLYACGLFIETNQGRYFCILNLQKLTISDKVICQEILFFNDLREVKFKCQFSMTTTAFKNPKMPDRIKIEEQQQARINALNLLKKPPVPKAQTCINNFLESEKQPYSFLQGGQKRQSKGKSQSQDKKNSHLPDHLKTLKSGLPRRSDVMKSLGREKYPQIPKEIMLKQPQLVNEDGDLLDCLPPPMEFTNDEPEVQTFQVPKVFHIDYADSTEPQFRPKPL